MPQFDPVSQPRRIQLSRKKGWRLPPNTVVVSRATRYWETLESTEKYQLPPESIDKIEFTIGRLEAEREYHERRLKTLDMAILAQRNELRRMYAGHRQQKQLHKVSDT